MKSTSIISKCALSTRLSHLCKWHYHPPSCSTQKLKNYPKFLTSSHLPYQIHQKHCQLYKIYRSLPFFFISITITFVQTTTNSFLNYFNIFLPGLPSSTGIPMIHLQFNSQNNLFKTEIRSSHSPA